MRFRRVDVLKSVLKAGTIVGLCFFITKAATGSARPAAAGSSATAAHAQGMQHPRPAHMHVRNWALEPTGVPGVSPLDPTTIPKFVSELTKPPVYVADNPGSRIPHYTVTYKKIQQQLLPSGLPTTQVFAYGGKANFNEADQSPDVRTTFLNTRTDVRSGSRPAHPCALREQARWRSPLPRRSHDHVRQSQQHPNAPCAIQALFANPNNIRTPRAPFKPFPPGYERAQDPIPVVTHLHGGVTPSDSDGYVTAWFTKDEEKKGPDFTSSTFEYFNAQLATTLWYHDHTLGMTRLTVAAAWRARTCFVKRTIRSRRCSRPGSSSSRS